MIRQAAFSLIEVLVTIVVIGISAVALTSVYSNMIAGSADPVIQQQSISIAEAYLEEISLRPFNNPDGAESGDCEDSPNPEAEDSRDLYDDVQDYICLAAGPAADQTGTPIPLLADYTVTITITNFDFNGVADNDWRRIEVSVNHPAVDPITLVGYRANY